MMNSFPRSLQLHCQCLLVLLFGWAVSSVHGAEPVSIKAAGMASRSLALYFEATYQPANTEGQANPLVQTAKLIIMSSRGRGTQPELEVYECTGDLDTVLEVQQTPYGSGTEGALIALLCLPDTFVTVLLYDEMVKRTSVRMPSGTCGPSAMLETRPVAMPQSFGHQAFCMEDWGSVSDPEARLRSEFMLRQDK